MNRVQRTPSPVLSHLARLSDHIGIVEHAKGLTPDRRHGYTAEDAARALVVTVRWDSSSTEASRLSGVYLSFLDRAIVNGGLRNRLSSDEVWGGPWSADAHGRVIWGLGIAAAEAVAISVSDRAIRVLRRLGPLDDPSLRPWVYCGLGAAALLDRTPDDPYGISLSDSAIEMLPHIHDGSWIWPEPRLTYDNARLPECMIALGVARGRPDLVDEGLRLLCWLIDIELAGDHFSFTPVGGRGPDDESIAFDQQPLEATAMCDACLAAWRATSDPAWLEHAVRAASWFLGVNDMGMPLYDTPSGAGHDGLTRDGINGNAGAESTISALWALQRVRALNLEQASRKEGSSLIPASTARPSVPETACMRPSPSINRR